MLSIKEVSALFTSSNKFAVFQGLSVKTLVFMPKLYFCKDFASSFEIKIGLTG